MNRDEALQLLSQVEAEPNFAGQLAKVQVFSVGKAPLRTYWTVRVAVLGGSNARWEYCDTPAAFAALQSECAE